MTQLPRPHIGLAVTDLTASRAFYDALLGPPVKVRDGYAKYSVESPPLNLSLNHAPDGATSRDGISHFGIEVASPDDVVAAERRLRAAGLPTRSETGTTCCYAVQDKVWVDDPDGRSWEVFVVLGDADTRDAPIAGGEASPARTCCAPECCA